MQLAGRPGSAGSPSEQSDAQMGHAPPGRAALKFKLLLSAILVLPAKPSCATVYLLLGGMNISDHLHLEGSLRLVGPPMPVALEMGRTAIQDVTPLNRVR